VKSSKPKLKIPLTIVEKVFEIVNLLIILGTGIFLLLNYFNLPDRIPTHFGISGQPDSWGGKGSLIAIFIVNFILYSSLTVLGRFPHVYNYLCEITEENAKFQYTNARMLLGTIKTEITIVFSYILWSSIWVAEEKFKGLGIEFIPVFIIVVFGTLALFIIRMVKGN
jgi:uncharacterized membrane protein